MLYILNQLMLFNKIISGSSPKYNLLDNMQRKKIKPNKYYYTYIRKYHKMVIKQMMILFIV